MSRVFSNEFEPPEEPGVEKLNQRWEGSIQYVTLRRDGRVYQEKRVWGRGMEQHPDILARERKLEESLPELKLQELDGKFRDTKARKLHLVLEQCPWRHFPANLQQSIGTIAGEGFRLKHSVAQVLGTRDAQIIQKVLSIDLGYLYPPLVDYEIRDSFEKELCLAEEKNRAVGWPERPNP